MRPLPGDQGIVMRTDAEHSATCPILPHSESFDSSPHTSLSAMSECDIKPDSSVAGTTPPSKDHNDADYVFDDADVILQSSDGILFHVHSVNMKLSSTVFRDMLPTKPSPTEVTNEPIALEEAGDVLKFILDILYSHIYQRRYASVIPPAVIKMSLIHLRDTALAVTKYNMEAAKQVLQELLSYKARNSANAKDVHSSFGCYALAWNLGWKEIARDISTLLISFDFHSKMVTDLLGDMDELASLKLRQLFEKRRDALHNMICDYFDELNKIPKRGNPTGLTLIADEIKGRLLAHCGCKSTPSIKHVFQWGTSSPRSLLLVINNAGVLDRSIMNSELLNGFWGVPCTVRNCAVMTDKPFFGSKLQIAINSLPNKIDISPSKALNLVGIGLTAWIRLD